MKSLSSIVRAAVSFGALALSGCTACEDKEKKAEAPAPVTCGPDTVAQGTQCVGKVK
jgi:hypothetical protein